MKTKFYDTMSPLSTTGIEQPSPPPSMDVQQTCRQPVGALGPTPTSAHGPILLQPSTPIPPNHTAGGPALARNTQLFENPSLFSAGLRNAGGMNFTANPSTPISNPHQWRPQNGLEGLAMENTQNSTNTMSFNDELRRGNLLTQKREFVFLIVGETGVGKTAFLNLVANILNGRDRSKYTHVHDADNEAKGSQKGSQTNAPRVYEFQSLNGVKVRVLDTPGLADTRGMKWDKEHKANITKTIQEAIPVINGVLIIANGTNPRLSISTDYALTTLSSIFPSSIKENITILFTMISNVLSFNFQMDSLPDCLRGVEPLLLDNPIALRKKYDEQCQMAPRALVSKLETMVDQAHGNAVDVLAEFFLWLDSCEVQPTTAILELHNKVCDIEMKIRDALSRMNDAANRKKQMQVLEQDMGTANRMKNAYKNFVTIVTANVKVQMRTTKYSTICSAPGCNANCHVGCQLDFSTNPDKLLRCLAFKGLDSTLCHVCDHSITFHYHDYTIWEERQNKQSAVDWDAMRKFENASRDKTKLDSALAEVKREILAYERTVESTTLEIGQLCQSYATLSLSGSFSAQISKSILLMETYLETLEGDKTADPQTIQSVRVAIDNLNQQNQIVANANNSVRRS